MDRCVRTLCAAGLAALTVGLTACETTGDPTRGGLFGWSEAKAKQDLKAQEQQNQKAQAQVAAAQEDQRTLRQQQAGLQSDNALLKTDLDQRLAENDRLTDQLHDLLSQRQLGEAQLARLRGALERNRQLRQRLQSSNGNTPANNTLLQGQNEELMEDIFALSR